MLVYTLCILREKVEREKVEREKVGREYSPRALPSRRALLYTAVCTHSDKGMNNNSGSL